MLDRYIGDAESLTAEPSGLTKGVDGEMRRSPPYISRGILVVLIVAVTVGQARTLGEIAETNLRYSAIGTAVKVMNTSKVELGERQKVLRRLADPRSLSHGCPPLRIQLPSFASSPDTKWLTQGRSATAARRCASSCRASRPARIRTG